MKSYEIHRPLSGQVCHNLTGQMRVRRLLLPSRSLQPTSTPTPTPTTAPTPPPSCSTTSQATASIRQARRAPSNPFFLQQTSSSSLPFLSSSSASRASSFSRYRCLHRHTFAIALSSRPSAFSASASPSPSPVSLPLPLPPLPSRRRLAQTLVVLVPASRASPACASVHSAPLTAAPPQPHVASPEVPNTKTRAYTLFSNRTSSTNFLPTFTLSPTLRRAHSTAAAMPTPSQPQTPTTLDSPLREHRQRPVERLTDKLETPSLDDRQYRVIKIASNQLEVLLVHDADTDKASAAMDVNVGNFSDPEDTPGMGHAVEHLLFMGTKKVSMLPATPWICLQGTYAD